MKSIFVCFALFYHVSLHAQNFSFDNPNIIFKDSAGNVLTAKEAMALAVKGPVSMNQSDLGNGKTQIILIRVSKETREKREQADQEMKKKWIGARLPEFALKNLKGETMGLAKLEGNYVVLNFWFVGCKPCVQEMPELNRLVDKYAKDPIKFIAPALDDKATIDKMMANREFKYQILTDAQALADQMNIFSYPTHIIINRDGEIKEIIVGGSADIFERLDVVIKEVTGATK